MWRREIFALKVLSDTFNRNLFLVKNNNSQQLNELILNDTRCKFNSFVFQNGLQLFSNEWKLV